MISKNDLINKFSNERTSLGIKRLIVNLFEELNFEKTRAGIDDFKRYLEENIPNIEKYVVIYTQKTGNGIVEILEDHYNL